MNDEHDDPGAELQAAWAVVARLIAAKKAAAGPPSAPVCRRCQREAVMTWAGLCAPCERKDGLRSGDLGVDPDDARDAMARLVDQRSAPMLTDRQLRRRERRL